MHCRSTVIGKRVAAAAGIAVVLLGAACKSDDPVPSPTLEGPTTPAAPPTPGSGPPIPERPVGFEPHDVTTNASPDHLRLVVLGQAYALGLPQLQRLAAEVSVLTLPARVEVPVTTEIVDVGQGSASYASPWNTDWLSPDERGVVWVRPSSPLAEGWYLLRVRHPPAGFRFSGGPVSFPDGSVGVRFRIGSQPILRLVQLSGSPIGVGVYFSEAFAEAPGPAIEVTHSDGRSAGCVFVGSSAGHWEGPFSANAAFRCDRLDVASELRVTFGAGLRGRSDVPFAAVDGSPMPEVRFVPATLPQIQPNNRIFKPPFVLPSAPPVLATPPPVP